MNTSEEVNTDSESETTIQKTTNNGSSSTEEPEQLELPLLEASSLLTSKDTLIELESLPPLDHGEKNNTRELLSTLDQEETSETMEESALMYMETVTLIIDTLLSGTAITDSTRPGTSTERSSNTTDIQKEMVFSSKSEPE